MVFAAPSPPLPLPPHSIHLWYIKQHLRLAKSKEMVAGFFASISYLFILFLERENTSITFASFCVFN